jgi:hypothetical protein
VVGFIIAKTADIRTQMLGAEEGSEVHFKDYTEVCVNQGSVNIVALTSDQLQLLVGVSGGMLLVYNIHDIVVKNVSFFSYIHFLIWCIVIHALLENGPCSFPSISKRD